MDNNDWKRYFESAGGWFVGEYAWIVIKNYDALQDKEFKRRFIEDIYNKSGRDSDYSGTRTRVNALLRLIDINEITKALQYIIQSDRIKRNDRNAFIKAKETLLKLQSKDK